MNDYIATFYTHLSALLTCQAMQEAGIAARMTPVPRALSSSCGTCVRFRASEDCRTLLDRDAEALYAAESGGYRMIWESEG